MSVYGRATCEMNDLYRLKQAVERAGLANRVKVYLAGDGVYRKYNGVPGCEGGKVRGRDAHLVIHGGLDNSGLYRPAQPELGGCGDTAFILQPDGSVKVEMDINHNNAPVNWELIQNYYQVIGVEQKAARMGVKIQLTVDEKTGTITGRAVQVRPTSNRVPAQRASVRPTAIRS